MGTVVAMIDWEKEPELTTDISDDGFLHWKGYVDKTLTFTVRYDYLGGNIATPLPFGFIDLWTLTYLPLNKKWTRGDIIGGETCKNVARSYLRHLERENGKKAKQESEA
jgi:hypothetical protein